MIPEETKKLFLDKYSIIGDDKFYEFLLNYANNRLALLKAEPPKSKTKSKIDLKNISPEVELLNYYNEFLTLYRKDDSLISLNVAKVFRRAAHTIYRVLLKNEMIDKNTKFLSAI